MTRKAAIAGKVDPALLQDLQDLKERQNLKTTSQAIEYVLMSYFAMQRAQNGAVTFGNPEGSTGVNSLASVFFVLDETEARIRELRKQLERAESKEVEA